MRLFEWMTMTTTVNQHFVRSCAFGHHRFRSPITTIIIIIANHFVYFPTIPSQPILNKNSSSPADHARWAPWSKGNTRRILIHSQGIVHYSDDSSPEARAGPSVSRLLQIKLDTWSRSAPFPFCSSSLGVTSFIVLWVIKLSGLDKKDWQVRSIRPFFLLDFV